MRTVFADAFYWIALTDKDDAWHQVSKAVSETLGPVRIVTTELVLTELLNHFSAAGRHWRETARIMVDGIRLNADIQVLRWGADFDFERGLALYAARPDKEYSFVECTSMEVMRELGIFEILTGDVHFEQEGFVRLIG